MVHVYLPIPVRYLLSLILNLNFMSRNNLIEVLVNSWTAIIIAYNRVNRGVASFKYYYTHALQKI